MSASRPVLAVSVLALLGVGALAYFVVARPADTVAPSITIDPDPVDFGDVPWLESPRKTLRVVNGSDHEVLLRNPHFTCACFSILTPLPAALRPGGSGTFEVQMWSVKGTPGRFQKELLIDTDDPAMPTLKTPVIGTITDYRSVSPSQLLFGVLEPDADPVEKKVEVRGGSGYVVSVSRAVVSDKRLAVEVRPVAGGSDLIVRTVAKPTKGFVSAQIQLSVAVGAPDGPKRTYTEYVRVSGEFK